jgi:hypothetical protein
MTIGWVHAKGFSRGMDELLAGSYEISKLVRNVSDMYRENMRKQ